VTVANLWCRVPRKEVDQARDRSKAGVANNIEVILPRFAFPRHDNQNPAL